MHFFNLILVCLLILRASSSILERSEERRSVFVHTVKQDAVPGEKNRQTSTVAKCICPANDPTEDDIAVRKALKRKTVNHLWSKSTPVFVGNQIKMKEVILKMLHSDVPLWQTTAFFSTTWLWSYLSSINAMPQLCSFAQLINATVTWDTSKNAVLLAEAIDQVAIALANSAVATGNNVIRAAGCVPPDATFGDTQCFEKGFAYRIDDMWASGGSLMPCAYERISKQLYQSKAYIDRLMAIISTISISAPFSEIADNIDKNLIYETMQYQNIMPIPACCCKGLIVKIKELNNAFSLEAAKSAAIVKSKYSKNWDRRNLPLI